MIRIRTKMAKRWSQQITSAKSPLTVLSPYITINRTLKKLAAKKATFYTRFDVRDFLSGASKVDAFELLLAAGCKIFVVPELHAKLIMDEDEFVTLGSQNLTEGGRSNKELSVCFDGPARDRTCEVVRNLVREWTTDPDLEQVDRDWLNRMVQDVETGRKAFENYEKALSEIERKASQAKEARSQVQQARREGERQSRKAATLAEFKETVRFAHPSGVHHLGTVTRPQKSACLMFKKDVDLLRWKKGKKDLDPLEKGSRCLCVFNERVGWARLAGGRITKIAESMKIRGTLPAPFKAVQIELTVKPEIIEVMPSDTTMVVNLSAPNGAELFSVALGYSLENTVVLGTHLPRGVKRDTKLKGVAQLRATLLDWVNSDLPRFEALLGKHITSTTPLKKKLEGVNADVYFGPLGSKVSVTMMFTARKQQHILVASTP